MIRVLIADDHAIVRSGFRQFVADEPDMEVAAEASTGDETIARVRESAFDVVMLDIAMPDKNGIDTLRVIKQIRPEQGVLMLSGYPESQYAINLLRAHEISDAVEMDLRRAFPHAEIMIHEDPAGIEERVTFPSRTAAR